MKQIYIYGASGHGLVVADIAKSCGYEKTIFVDDGDNKFLTFEEIKHNIYTPVALGIGSNKTRELIYKKLKNTGFEIVTLISPSSIISSSATIDEATVIMPNVVVNAKARIGKGVILNTSSIIEHECSIEDFVHISPNAALAGNVNVGKSTHIGIGTNIIQGIKVGQNTIIGAGSTVTKDMDANKKCFGTPCREIEDIK